MSESCARFSADAVGAHGAKKLKRGLDGLRGVRSVAVNRETGLICVDYDGEALDEKELERRIKGLGFAVSPPDGGSRPS